MPSIAYLYALKALLFFNYKIINHKSWAPSIPDGVRTRNLCCERATT